MSNPTGFCGDRTVYLRPSDDREKWIVDDCEGKQAIRCLDCCETRILRWKSEEKLRHLVEIHKNCVDCESWNVVRA